MKLYTNDLVGSRLPSFQICNLFFIILVCKYCAQAQRNFVLRIEWEICVTIIKHFVHTETEEKSFTEDHNLDIGDNVGDMSSFAQSIIDNHLLTMINSSNCSAYSYMI